MPYALGIDIGGTTTAAAISRLGAHGWSEPRVVPLGVRSVTVPSVLHLDPGGGLAVGEPTRPDPTRVARGFSRRVGDDVPYVVGGEPCTPQALTAVLAMWVAESVLAREGRPAEQIVLSHPAGWGGYRRELLRRALWHIGLANVALLPEPVLAAERHAVGGPLGGTLAVYSLGGGSCEASVVSRADPVGYRLLASAAPADHFGGDDVDQALFDLVLGKLGRHARELAGARLARYELRRECARGKERLGAVAEIEVPVRLPGRLLHVPVTRAELEAAVRPALRQSVGVLARAVESCGLDPSALDGVVLTGGATRMPLVAELVAAEVPVPVVLDTAPELTAALGAACAAAQMLTPAPEPAAAAPVLPEPPVWTPDPAPAPPPRPSIQITPLNLAGARS